MKKLFLYTLAGALLYSTSTWAMALEEKIGQQPSKIKIAHKQTQTDEGMYPIDAHILARTDLPFSLALETFDTGKLIVLPGEQALKLDRNSVSKGRWHIPSGVFFHASGAYWYEDKGKTWLHISYTSHHNPHWALKFRAPIIPDGERYWNRETVIPSTDVVERQMDFEFVLIPSAEISGLSLRSSVVTPWLCTPSEEVIPLREHIKLLETGDLYPIPEGYVKLVRTAAPLSAIKGWGDFVTTSNHRILQAVNPLLEQGWCFTSLPKPSGYFADIFRTSGAEDPDREIKKGMLALAREENWVGLRVSGHLIPPEENRFDTMPVEPLSLNYTLLLEFFSSPQYTAQANEYRLTGKRVFREDKQAASTGFSTELEALFSGGRKEQAQRLEAAAAAADDTHALLEE